MSDTSKLKVGTIREEDREESPFESQGLKNLNLQSPTPKADGPLTGTRSPAYNSNQNTARKSPGNETPDDWRTSPTEGDKTMPNTGRSGQNVPQSSKPGTRNGGYTSPTNRNQNNQSPGNRSQGNKTPGNQSQGNKSPGNRSQGNRTPGNQSQHNKSPGNQSQGKISPDNRSQGNVSPNNQTNRSQNNTQRQQDSGLDEV